VTDTNAPAETAPASPAPAAAPAPASKPVKKKAAPAKKKAAPKKKATPAKKAPKKAAKAKKAAVKKAPTKRTEPTIRHRVFTLLNKSPNGYTGAQIKEKLELAGVPNLLKDEGLSDKPRIKRVDIEGVRGVVYQLTAAGRKAVADGTVDSNAAESAARVAWPDGK
jgi:hypothetical protein